MYPEPALVAKYRSSKVPARMIDAAAVGLKFPLEAVPLGKARVGLP